MCDFRLLRCAGRLRERRRLATPLLTSGLQYPSTRDKKEQQMKAYVKPVLVKLGSLALIKSNSTGPSSDGKKYAGFFK